MQSSSQDQDTSTTQKSYANITMQPPTKENATVIDAIEGLTVQDYAEAIGNLIDPMNITHISRISKNRVCLYFKSKQIAQQFVDKHPKIKIQNQIIDVRLLTRRTKRVIFPM